MQCTIIFIVVSVAGRVLWVSGHSVDEHVADVPDEHADADAADGGADDRLRAAPVPVSGGRPTGAWAEPVSTAAPGPLDGLDGTARKHKHNEHERLV